MGKRDDDDERRRRRREREDEQDEADLKRKGATNPGRPLSTPKDGGSEKFFELLERVEPMIEQLNNLYNMFMTGVEKLPPHERRQQLDQTMSTLQLMPKPTASAQFRFSAVQQRYTTYRDRWDKMLKGLEKGTHQRKLGNKN